MTARSAAFYMHDLSGGGVERMRLSLIAELRARGLAVTLILGRRHGKLSALIPDDLPVIDLRSTSTLQAIRPLVRALRTIRPDVLVSSLDHNNITALLAAPAARTPVIICQHNALSAESGTGWKYRAIPWLYWLLQHRAAGIVAVSRGVAEDLARTARIPRAAITPIYNPVIDAAFAARAAGPSPHAWLEDDGPPVLLFAGRLTRQKDPATLIDAFALLTATHSARLLVLGEGPLQPQLEAQIARLGVGASIILAGFQPKPLPWIARAACLVLPSRYEGLGNVLIEALACGTPVIATDCPHGPAEILDGGRFGRLVPAANPPALAHAMAAAITEPPDGQALRLRAQAFTAAACAQAHLALFDSVLRQRPIRAFGLTFSPLTTASIVARLIEETPTDVQLVVTPNIDHLRLLRQPDFSAAYRSAALTCPDGFPILLYARLRGLPLTRRITGCALFARLATDHRLSGKRLCVVVESQRTATAMLRWATATGLSGSSVLIAPEGLAADRAAQSALAARIATANPAILVMTLGAPLSEVFIHQHRHRLPPCWALCVGQAVRIHLGLTQRAPPVWQRLGLEWLWRVKQEPRRLAGRYVRALAWFPLAIWADIRGRRDGLMP